MDRKQLLKLPPSLPRQYTNAQFQFCATRNQRIRAGLIDHFIDSTVWLWFFVIVIWTAFHLQVSMDTRAFFTHLCSNFSTSIILIGLLFIGDFLLCVYRGQSLGQLINGIYKTSSPSPFRQTYNQSFTVLRVWIHGFISRCLGLPLLVVSLIFWLSIDPIICPIHIQQFSLIEPEGSYLLIIFLLKIIGSTLLMFGLFLPAGLAFLRGTLPTCYDRLLKISVLQTKIQSHD
jgi:hypothetical protein